MEGCPPAYDVSGFFFLRGTRQTIVEFLYSNLLTIGVIAAGTAGFLVIGMVMAGSARQLGEPVGGSAARG